MQTGITIIICCYNSSVRLPETLKHLVAQVVPADLSWEILIVDNNSTDNTAGIAQAEWNKYDSRIPLRVVCETIPGLSAAREAGIKEAEYDYLIFCDDDNWLASYYVANAFRILDANPGVAAIGGINIGAYEKLPPDWMSFFEASYAIGKQGKTNFEILDGHSYLVGAGMAFKKEAYNDVKRKGFKFYLTDRIGDKVVGGGDIELCFIFKLAGYTIAYTSELVLQHYMPASRITEKYLKNMWHHYPHSWLIFEAYKVVLDKKKEKFWIIENYWKIIALKRLSATLKKAHIYVYRKLKNDIEYCLPVETNLLYNIYIEKKSKLLVDIIRELRNIVGYE
jgi:glycosyltransferase involved in cell wall biosynthesis